MTMCKLAFDYKDDVYNWYKKRTCRDSYLHNDIHRIQKSVCIIPSCIKPTWSLSACYRYPSRDKRIRYHLQDFDSWIRRVIRDVAARMDAVRWTLLVLHQDPYNYSLEFHKNSCGWLGQQAWSSVRVVQIEGDTNVAKRGEFSLDKILSFELIATIFTCKALRFFIWVQLTFQT